MCVCVCVCVCVLVLGGVDLLSLRLLLSEIDQSDCELTIEMPAALSHASVVTRCQPFKMPRPIACVCARSSLSRLDALSRKLRNLESLGAL